MKWQHQVRDFLRARLQAAVAAKRHHLPTVIQGINREATTQLYKALPPGGKGIARSWMTDGICYGDRRARRGLDDGSCRFCDHHSATPMHRLWECQAFARVRFIQWEDIQQWPYLFLCFGIVPKLWNVRALPKGMLTAVYRQCLMVQALALMHDEDREGWGLPGVWGCHLGVGGSWAEIERYYNGFHRIAVVPQWIPPAEVDPDAPAPREAEALEDAEHDRPGQGAMRQQQRQLVHEEGFTRCTNCGRRQKRGSSLHVSPMC